MFEVGAQHKASFAIIGLFDAVFLVALFAAVANLPGAVLPVLAQAMLVWNFLLSVTVLGKRCALVTHFDAWICNLQAFCDGTPQLQMFFAHASVDLLCVPLSRSIGVVVAVSNLGPIWAPGCRFTAVQLIGAALVAAGAVVAAGGNAAVGMSIPLGSTALYVGSMLFVAMGSIMKERIFRRAGDQLGQPLSVFVVNTFGSLCQVPRSA